MIASYEAERAVLTAMLDAGRAELRRQGALVGSSASRVAELLRHIQRMAATPAPPTGPTSTDTGERPPNRCGNCSNLHNWERVEYSRRWRCTECGWTEGERRPLAGKDGAR